MMTPIDSSVLAALRCFQVAGRLLSFTRAAGVLNLTQSAVSQQIRHLEDRLGYPLFFRQSRTLKLTANGEVLLDATTRALTGIQETLQRLGLPNAPLQVNCLPSFALQWLMPRLTDFQQQQPATLVRLKAEFQSLNRLLMDEENIDIAVRYDPLAYEPQLSETLLDEYLLPVATPTYLARQPGFATGETADGVVFLHDASPWAEAPEFIEWREWTQAFHPAWSAHIDGPQFNLSSLAISAALNHQGVAMGRTALVHDELKSGRLVIARPLALKASAQYNLLFRSRSDARVATFLKWMKSEAQQFAGRRSELLLELGVDLTGC